MNQEFLQFAHKIVRDSLREIYRTQAEIASRRIYREPQRKTGKLRESLLRPSTMVKYGKIRLEARLDYPIYIRFLDMKRMGNHKIYNRPLWGIIYKQALREIRYEYIDWLRQWFSDELRKCFQ